MTQLCLKCGSPMILLFTSWACDFCDDPDNAATTKSYGFIQVADYWLSQQHTTDPYVAPQGTLMFIYKTEQEVRDILQPNHSIGMINITYEPNVKFSSIWTYENYVITRDLTFTVIKD